MIMIVGLGLRLELYQERIVAGVNVVGLITDSEVT